MIYIPLVTVKASYPRLRGAENTVFLHFFIIFIEFAYLPFICVNYH